MYGIHPEYTLMFPSSPIYLPTIISFEKKIPNSDVGIRFSIIKLFFPFPFSSSLFYFVYQVSLLSFLLTNFFSTRTPLHFFFFFHNSTLYLEKIFSLTKRREEKETRREERKKPVTEKSA